MKIFGLFLGIKIFWFILHGKKFNFRLVTNSIVIFSKATIKNTHNSYAKFMHYSNAINAIFYPIFFVLSICLIIKYLIV